MARKTTRRVVKRDPEEQGRTRFDQTRNIKKGSRMPPRKGKETLKKFIVADGVRIGHPNLDLTQHDHIEDRVAEEGDNILLTKSQAEWCLANGFIDSLLPDFDPPAEPELQADAQPDAGVRASEEEDGTAADGSGEQGVDGASAEDAVPATPKRTPRRAKSAL